MTEGATSAVTESVEVHAMSIACDGGEGALGHPRVWLHIDPESQDVVCPYCSCRFVLADGAEHGGH